VRNKFYRSYWTLAEFDVAHSSVEHDPFVDEQRKLKTDPACVHNVRTSLAVGSLSALLLGRRGYL
jgi:hypothetical protein